MILNADDNFFRLHQSIAIKNNINPISFGIKNHKADVKLINIIKKSKYNKYQTLKILDLISSKFLSDSS